MTKTCPSTQTTAHIKMFIRCLRSWQQLHTFTTLSSSTKSNSLGLSCCSFNTGRFSMSRSNCLDARHTLRSSKSQLCTTLAGITAVEFQWQVGQQYRPSQSHSRGSIQLFSIKWKIKCVDHPCSIHFFTLGLVAGYCKYSNEPLDSTKSREFLNQLTTSFTSKTAQHKSEMEKYV